MTKKQISTFPIKEVVEDIGLLFAGLSTIKDGRTLREVKPKSYEPKTQFGKLIDKTVKNVIKNERFNYRMELMDTLTKHPELVSIAQKEVEKAFIKHFGKEKLTSSQKIDKIFGRSVISKLSYLAKTNGVPKEEVDNLIEQTVRSVFNRNTINNSKPMCNKIKEG